MCNINTSTEVRSGSSEIVCLDFPSQYRWKVDLLTTGLPAGCKSWCPGIGLQVLAPSCSQGPTLVKHQSPIWCPATRISLLCASLLFWYAMKVKRRKAQPEISPLNPLPWHLQAFFHSIRLSARQGQTVWLIHWVSLKALRWVDADGVCWLMLHHLMCLLKAGGVKCAALCFCWWDLSWSCWIYHCNCSILLLSNVSLNPQSKDNFEVWLCLQCDYTGDSSFPFKSESSSKAHESEGLFNYFLICQQYTQLFSDHKDM